VQHLSASRIATRGLRSRQIEGFAQIYGGGAHGYPNCPTLRFQVVFSTGCDEPLHDVFKAIVLQKLKHRWAAS
jgi:hypothetical protein